MRIPGQGKHRAVSVTRFPFPPLSSPLFIGCPRCGSMQQRETRRAKGKSRREKERGPNKRGPDDRARLLAIPRSPRNRISIGTVINELRFGFVVILNDLFVHGHLLHPPLPPRHQETTTAIIIIADLPRALFFSLDAHSLFLLFTVLLSFLVAFIQSFPVLRPDRIFRFDIEIIRWQ